MPEFTFIDLFAGIGGFRQALSSVGGQCVFSSEWDLNSQHVYFDNYGERPFGDITKIEASEIPSHDLLAGGFPCQAFSISGKRLGFEDSRGTLFYDIARIASHHKPKVLLLENVRNLANHDQGRTLSVIVGTLEEIGYTVFHKVLRSSDFGVPQARERIYIVAIRDDLCASPFYFPSPLASHKVVEDILEANVPDDLFIRRPDMQIGSSAGDPKDPRRPMQIGKINKGGQGERIYSTKASGITLSAYGGGAAAKTGAFLVNGKVRKLSPRECARLQGFPEDFRPHPNRNLAYKQFGDSVSIPVLKAIIDAIFVQYEL